MKRIVLDTNVLLSGMINPAGPPGEIVDALRRGEVTLVADDRILAEYAEVLNRPVFRRYFDETAGDHVMSFVTGNGERILATVRVAGLPDEADAPFAECALTAGVPLVTGNARHYPAAALPGLRVLTPARCAAWLREVG